MNKRCTNPSCRKTFSTLNYGGQCPFCGKRYPQLESARKDGLPAPIIHGLGKPGKKETGPFIRIMIQRKDACRAGKRSIDICLRDVLAFGVRGEKIKAIKALREEMSCKGYAIGLKDAKDFFEAIMSRRSCSRWQTTNEGIKPILSKPSRRDRGVKKVLAKTIEELAFSVRTCNCLKRAGINTVAELVQIDKGELARVRNLGKTSQAEIMEKLSALGLSLRGGDHPQERCAKKEPKPPEPFDLLDDLDAEIE